MQEKSTFFAQDFYQYDLSTINKIRFTRREIDVIACLVNALGAKKTATLLGLKLSGVNSHLVNIRSKLECNSGAAIISFIEDSSKLQAIRHYFCLLQSEILFKKSLQHIAKINSEKKECCIYIQEKDKDSFLLHLQSHLKVVSLLASISMREKKANYTLFIFPKLLMDAPLSSFLPKIMSIQNKVILLLRGKRNSYLTPQELKKWDIIDFTKPENYFFSFFALLKKLLPHLNLETIITEFTDKYKKIQVNYQSPEASQKREPEQASPIYKKETFLISVCLLFIILGGFSAFYWVQTKHETSALRSDLLIPRESAFLNRPELIAQIDNVFKNHRGIQTVALVGIGGAGKTTLARQYAHEQKTNVIWEINAETRGSLYGSFAKLAHSLAKTEKDQKTLKKALDIKDSLEKKEQIIVFVKERLKLLSPWLLIFDNVEDFSDIQKYFPLHIETWGQGKVILTTRNAIIQNNPLISHIISTGELTSKQKLEFFTKIMRGEEPYVTENEEMLAFLEKIPPFPLDISIAAYYLKSTNIPYSQYLEKLENYTKETNIVHENILKETGEYTKTRYAIITHSLEHLQRNHKVFSDLLLFISLLDSQNIPKELLDSYKNSSIVDNFIYHLKKHSLLTAPALASSLEPIYSIHRSAQMISLSYLIEILKLKKESSLLKEITCVLDDYADKNIEQEDFPKMQITARHIEKMLGHNLLTDFSKGLLESKLGSIYYFINDDKSKKLIDDSLSLLEMSALGNLSSEESLKLARSFLHIGAVYTELRLYKKAQQVLEKAIRTYRQEDTKNHANLSWALSHLANIYRRLGDYETARIHLEESLHLHEQYGIDKKRMARILAYLGSVYRGLGFYQKAIDALEESLAIYNKNYPNNHFRIGWTLTRLGNVYSDLGDFKKAKECFEKGLFISKKYFPEDHQSIGLTLTYLGNCHRELGNYEKSRDVLEQSLKIHEKRFDKKYRRIGWVSFHLGRTYQALGKYEEAHKLYDTVLEIYTNYCDEEDIETAGILRNMAIVCLEKNRFKKAENFITSSLKNLESRHHVDAYRSLEVLGEIYLKKSVQLAGNKNTQESQYLKAQAQDLFGQALKIAESNLPENSIHIERIKSKMKSMKQKTN